MALSYTEQVLSPECIPFVFPGLPSVKCLFTTRYYGNVSLSTPETGTEDLHRRVKLHAMPGLSGWTELHQVHGDVMVVDPEFTDPSVSASIKADGSCTSRPGHALLIKTADCQPILLAHKSGNFVAAMHSGWRGNAISFPVSGVEAFCRAYSIKPSDIMAIRGPSLGPAAAEFVNFHAEWPSDFAEWYDPTTKTVDLWRLLEAQLLKAGLLSENIYSLDLCTKTMNSLFFSHRCRDAGRQASLIYIAK